MLENSSWRPGEYGNSGFQDISMCTCLFLLYLQKQSQRQYMECLKTAASEHKPLVQTLCNMKLTVQMSWPHTCHRLMGSRREKCGLRGTTDNWEAVMPLSRVLWGEDQLCLSPCLLQLFLPLVYILIYFILHKYDEQEESIINYEYSNKE